MGNQNKFTFNRFLQYQIIFVLFLTLSGCQNLLPSQHARVGNSQRTSITKPPATRLQNPLPNPPWHWNGIIPGQSTPEDVEAILGPPYSIYTAPSRGRHTNPEFPDWTVWQYWSFRSRPVLICPSNCDGWMHVIFTHDTLVMVRFFHRSPINGPRLDSLIEAFGEPDLWSSIIGPTNPGEVAYYEEQGFGYGDIMAHSTAWQIVYPEYGLFFQLGPNFVDEEHLYRVLYPPKEFPPDFTGVWHLEIFAPLTVEEYMHSELAYPRLKPYEP